MENLLSDIGRFWWDAPEPAVFYAVLPLLEIIYHADPFVYAIRSALCIRHISPTLKAGSLPL